MTETPERPVSPVLDLESFARAYRACLPRLQSEARGLLKTEGTGRPQPANESASVESTLVDGLVWKAAFRVWRRLATAESHIELTDELSDELVAAVWQLAPSARTVTGPSVGLLAAQLGQLPRRQVTALWLADALGLPLAAVGRQLRSNRNATAVLLHRAREGVRQAYLREQPGTPERASCAEHWERMPAHIRGTDSSSAAAGLACHVARCDDCHARLRQLVRASDELAALVGPALLSLLVEARAPYLVPLAGTGATDAVGGLARERSSAGNVTPFRFVRRLAYRAFGQSNSAGGGLVTVAAVSAAMAAGVAITATGEGVEQSLRTSCGEQVTCEDTTGH